MKNLLGFRLAGFPVCLGLRAARGGCVLLAQLLQPRDRVPVEHGPVGDAQLAAVVCWLVRWLKEGKSWRARATGFSKESTTHQERQDQTTKPPVERQREVTLDEADHPRNRLDE